MSLEKVLDAIPHRPPFLWVDEVVEATEDRIRAAKRVDPEEPALRGHYPGFPILPGVLVLESMFQAGAILLSRKAGAELAAGKLPVLVRARDARFKRMVRPGDLMEIEVELEDALGGAYKLSGEVKVAGETAASVDFTVALVDASGGADA